MAVWQDLRSNVTKQLRAVRRWNVWISDAMHRKLEKHGREIARMGSAEHKELVPLVEVSLAIMRLACEKFFVLISVLATYLLFRDDAPRPARLLIRLNHRLSVLFQRVC